MEIEAVIEIPKGSRNKYEIDHDSGAVWLEWRGAEEAERVVLSAQQRAR